MNEDDQPAADPSRLNAGSARPPVTMGMLGMTLFLASLSMLFAASLMGFLVVRLRAEAWPPSGAPGLPSMLWLGTGVILLASFAVQGARRSAFENRQASLKAWLIATFLLGLVFLAVQADNWREMALAYRGRKPDLYAFTFYMLTVLHGAHVLGGLVSLVVVTVKAFLGRYRAGEARGVRYCTVYWHFLDVVWLIMFAVMMVAS